MTQQTFSALSTALHNADFDKLFLNVTGSTPEEYEDNKRFGLSFNVETNELQFINYITNEDKSWVSVFEQQNPCIIVGYVGADDIILGNPANSIIEDYIAKFDLLTAQIEVLEYTLPDYLASYLINGDTDGITEQEIAEIDAYLKHESVCIVGMKEDSSFRWRNDLNNVGASCSTYIAHKHH